MGFARFFVRVWRVVLRQAVGQIARRACTSGCGMVGAVRMKTVFAESDENMNVQVIERDGQAEYAVLPWAEYQELLKAAGREPARIGAPVLQAEQPCFALENLRRLREERNLGLEELARAVGISPHYLALIESGERQPDQAIQRALARLLATPATGQPG